MEPNSEMKVYQLFSEFCDREIYGTTPEDAIMHAGPLSRPRQRGNDSGQLIAVPPITIQAVHRQRPTGNSTRGWRACESYICDAAEPGGPTIRICLDLRRVD